MDFGEGKAGAFLNGRTSSHATVRHPLDITNFSASERNEGMHIAHGRLHGVPPPRQRSSTITAGQARDAQTRAQTGDKAENAERNDGTSAIIYEYLEEHPYLTPWTAIHSRKFPSTV